MDKSDVKLQLFLNYALYFILIFSLSHMLGIGISLSTSLFIEIVLILLAAAAARYIVHNPLSLYFISVILVFSTLIANQYFQDSLYRAYSWLIGFMNNVINNFTGRENIEAGYAIPYFLLLSFAVAVFTAIILFKSKNIFILLPVHLAAYLLYWYNFRDQAYVMMAIFIAAYLVLWSIRAYNRKFPAELFRTWISTAVKYSVLIVILALILPKTNNHATIPWLQEYVHTTFPSVEDMRSNDSTTRGVGTASNFDFSTTGFQAESSRLGGPVVQNDSRVMTVRSSRSLYLRGNIKHTYTGSSWEAITEPSQIYKLLDDISGITEGDKQRYYDSVETVVTFRDFASTTVFSPLFPETINSFDTKNFILARDGYLAAPGGLYDGEGYYLKSLVPKPYGIRLANGQTEVLDHIEDIELYLQLPDSFITDRTINLAHELILDKETTYEKAVAIEAYLRSSFPYNMEVGYVPQGYDFVDYFLFEEGEGYCTYYASALTVMLRIIDIPARYVEGFVVRGPAEDGVYEVTNKNAHAWVEAFIDPVGWVTFEPTPSQPLPIRLEDYGSEEPDTDDFSSPGGMGRDPDGHDEPDFESQDEDDLNGYESQSFNGITLILVILILLLIAAIPGRLIYGIYKAARRDAETEALNPNERIISSFSTIVVLLDLLGYPSNKGETHSEYARRISYKFSGLDGTGIIQITEAFIRAKYGNIYPDDSILEQTRVFELALEERLKRHLGTAKFYWLKYVKNFNN